MAKIYLSPSNQDNNAYAWGNTVESEQCNRIAEATKTALERNGFEVLKAPEGQLMNTSIAESNNWGADLHIPIHTNAGGGKGTEIFIYDESARPLAQCIMNEITSITPDGINRRIAINQGLAEINSTNATAIYIEVDFHDNPEIARWIVESTTMIGEHICKGICEYYEVQYRADEQPISSIEWIWYEDHRKWAARQNGKWVYDKWLFDPNYNAWYRIDKDGWMLNCGWYKEGIYWYYLNTDGTMQTGWLFVEGKWYYMDEDGRMLSNTTVDGYVLGADGAWVET